MNPLRSEHVQPERIGRMKMSKVKLESWSVVDNGTFQEFRNLAPGQRLTGRVKGLFGIPHGTVFSAAIVSIDEKRQRVRTANAVYKLGAINQAYENWAGQTTARIPAQAVAGLSIGTASAVR
jgi:hypothetical protein